MSSHSTHSAPSSVKARKRSVICMKAPSYVHEEIRCGSVCREDETRNDRDPLPAAAFTPMSHEAARTGVARGARRSDLIG